ncbi:DUF4430 domain-containing protein [Enterococcus sp. LJL128]
MKKKLFLAITLIFGVSVISGCSNENDKKSDKMIEVTVTLLKDQEDFAHEVLEVAEGSTLMEVMKQEFEVEEKQGMITSIEGVKQDEAAGYYWVYTINSETINTGAKETKLKAGDDIEFFYEKI